MVKIAIDLGSSTTKIYRADTNSGIVLAEPSCVAVVGEEGEVRAIGKEAKNLLGKTAECTRIVYPVYEGKIVDMPLAIAMLKEFFNRIDMKASALRRAQVLFSVPCGIPDDDLQNYAILAEECGVRKAWFVEQPYLAALGCGAILSETEPVFCLDIGGGVTNAAIISADGIISGFSMNVGGNNMDTNVIAQIARTHNLHVGTLTAERVKNELGSLSPAALGTMVVQGSSTDTYQPHSAPIQAADVTPCVRVYVDKVIEYVAMALRNLSAEVAATVSRGGVYLSGGLMKIQHLPQYLGSKLGMRFLVSEEPQFATVLGGGVLLRDKALLLRFAKKID